MLTDIRLQHYRSYKDASFDLGPGVNILVGPNASGKTNLLEAILVLCKGNSYRAKDQELIEFKQDWARLDANMTNGGIRTVKLNALPSLNKTYEIEGQTYKRLTLERKLPVVLFEPNHLQLISAGPERRRDYLDDLLEQIEPGYGSLRRQYKRTLLQRNTLLKKGPTSSSQLFPWDVRISHLAGQIVRHRRSLIDKLNSSLPALYRELSGSKTKVALDYSSKWPIETYESQLLKKLETSRELDHLRGFTADGPHREDLQIFFNGHLAQEIASRGENRTLVLALKIMELKLVEAARDQTPTLLLDDVFSELDGKRRRALTEHLKNYQTFITTTDADIILHHFTDDCEVIAL